MFKNLLVFTISLKIGLWKCDFWLWQASESLPPEVCVAQHTEDIIGSCIRNSPTTYFIGHYCHSYWGCVLKYTPNEIGSVYATWNLEIMHIQALRSKGWVNSWTTKLRSWGSPKPIPPNFDHQWLTVIMRMRDCLHKINMDIGKP